MKHVSEIACIFLAAFIAFSCHQNRLKINQKELEKEMNIQEKENYNSRTNSEKNSLADTGKLIPKAFRLKENRAVDLRHPPEIIDIAGNLNMAHDLKLSDVATEITYIRMDPVPDSTIPVDLIFRYQILDDYIIAVNLYGIHLYSNEGAYLRPIVKNEWTGIEVDSDEIRIRNDYTLKGGGMSVQTKGNCVYYNYRNNISGQNYIMNYNCSSISVAPDYKFDPENPDKISGLGTPEIDLNYGRTESPKPRSHQGMFGGSQEDFFHAATVTMLDTDICAIPSNGQNMMAITNKQGDTITAFNRFEKLINYKKSIERSSDIGVQYEWIDDLYLRPAFNDTVFRLIPPNRLLPVYVLNLGSFKVTIQEGVDPGVKLTGKIIPGEWAETNNYIFMTFAQDDYDCLNTRKNNTVKIYHAIYSKLNHWFSVIKSDPFDYTPAILENNIDGGVPVWPSSYMIGHNGEILIPLKGKDLKERVRSKGFRFSDAPDARKKELEKIAGSVTGTDDILMIIK